MKLVKTVQVYDDGSLVVTFPPGSKESVEVQKADPTVKKNPRGGPRLDSRRDYQVRQNILDESKVREIRKLLAENELRVTAIARRYKVSHSTISSIKHGHSWRHVV